MILEHYFQSNTLFPPRLLPVHSFFFPFLFSSLSSFKLKLNLNNRKSPGTTSMPCTCTRPSATSGRVATYHQVAVGLLDHFHSLETHYHIKIKIEPFCSTLNPNHHLKYTSNHLPRPPLITQHPLELRQPPLIQFPRVSINSMRPW
jgi:hypothetical protein